MRRRTPLAHHTTSSANVSTTTSTTSIPLTSSSSSSAAAAAIASGHHPHHHNLCHQNEFVTSSASSSSSPPTTGSRPGSAASSVNGKSASPSSTASSSSASLFDPSGDRDELRVYILVATVAVLCYLNGLPGDFVHDDIPAITINKDVLGTSSVSAVFQNDFWGTPMADMNSHKSYRPLTILSFRLNHLLFGLRPVWFHATNILLHMSVCILFTRVCGSVAGLRKNFAALAGLLFAVHPIHTEAVTGIVGRADVLACIFFLISLLAYHGQPESPDSWAVWFSIALGGVSMLAKETGITVFLLNLAYDLYRCWPALRKAIVDVRWSEETQQFSQRASKVVLSMGLLMAVRLALLQGSFPKFSNQDNPAAFHPNLYVRILTFCYLAAFNWWLILCPSTISHDWQMGSIPLVTSVSDPRNLLTMGALITACLLLYKGVCDCEAQRHIPLVLGFLLLVVPFLPATNILVTVGFVVAERVLYIPSLGGVLLVVYGIQLAWEHMPRYRSVVTCLTIVLIASGGCKTIDRNRDWNSREALLRAGLSVLPHNAKMHYNFGNWLRDSAQPSGAMVHYQEALRLWPSYASAHNNLGTLMSTASKAEWHFKWAIRYSGEHVNAHYNLGQLYRKLNRTGEAARMFERCILLDSTFMPAYLELIKLRSGTVAGRLLREVIRMSPMDPDRLALYGFWLLENHFVLDALRQFKKTLRIKDTHQMAFIGTCRTLRKLGQTSRLLQEISRWQVMTRIQNGGSPRQSDIYLRDWSIKNELRNRAMIYDYKSKSSPNTGKPKPKTTTKSPKHTSPPQRAATSTATNRQTLPPPPSIHHSHHYPHHNPPPSPMRRLDQRHTDDQNCNMSAESLQRPTRQLHTAHQMASTAAGCHGSSCPGDDRPDDTERPCNRKRWTKSRHKYANADAIASVAAATTTDADTEDSRRSSDGHQVSPLFVSNILDKL